MCSMHFQDLIFLSGENDRKQTSRPKATAGVLNIAAVTKSKLDLIVRNNNISFICQIW